MKLSTDRILTTHVGSLPRPPDLLAMLEARETGQGFDEAAFEARLARAVREIVEQQVAAASIASATASRARSPTPSMFVTAFPASAHSTARKSTSRRKPPSISIWSIIPMPPRG
jgi:hypothetical protein